MATPEHLDRNVGCVSFRSDSVVFVNYCGYMNPPPRFSVLALSKSPLQTACFRFKKPVPIWLGIYQATICVERMIHACTVYEATDSQDNDVIHVDGFGRAMVTRQGHTWPFRVMPNSAPGHLMTYAKELRAAVARLKPIQSCFSGGYISLESVANEATIDTMNQGVPETLFFRETNRWLSTYDLVQFCSHEPTDWRLTCRLGLLRQ